MTYATISIFNLQKIRIQKRSMKLLIFPCIKQTVHTSIYRIMCKTNLYKNQQILFRIYTPTQIFNKDFCVCPINSSPRRKSGRDMKVCKYLRGYEKINAIKNEFIALQRGVRRGSSSAINFDLPTVVIFLFRTYPGSSGGCL